MTSLNADKAHKKTHTRSPAAIAAQERGEQAVHALQSAQNNFINHIAELSEATPVHQTLSNLIAKDILIVASVLFWPALIYWLW
ncbi:MAG: hypothetical protein JKX91_15730 [Rhizobiaceae bacterium]|nr:hypothetical protein [Rhizobiaceae bacterium]